MSSEDADAGEVEDGDSEDGDVSQDFLPAFDDLLRSIETVCLPGGKLAGDLRSTELLRVVRNLMHRTSGNSVANVVTPAPHRLSPDRGISVTWIEGFALLLMLTAIVAAMLNWARF